MNIGELLANPQTLLECAEPWPGNEADGKDCLVNVSRLLTVDAAVKIQRAINFDKGKRTGTDSDLLMDFIAVNWATVFKPK